MRNGSRPKTVISDAAGEVVVDVPRDREGTFEPQIVKKRQRRLTDVDEIVLSLYAKGLTTGEISAHFAEVYGASVSRETISRITDTAANRHRHGQRRVDQLGVVMLAQGEADEPPRAHVQHRVQVQLALGGDDLGAVAIPLAVDPLGGEPAPDQVRGPPPAPPRAGAAAALALAAGDQPLLGHDLRDGVLTDPPTLLAQVRGDPRGTVAAAVRGEQPADLGRELLAPGPPPRGVPVTPLVKPGWADPQRPARGGLRDAVLGPLGGDEPGHRYRPIASFTQRATERLRTSRCIRSSMFSLTQPLQLGALALAHRRVAALPAPSLPSTPVTQRALVDAQLPGHLRDRLARLEHQPHRALLGSLDQISGTAVATAPPQSDVSTLRGEAQGLDRWCANCR